MTVHVRSVEAHSGVTEGSATVDHPSVVMYKLGGKLVPLRSAWNCKVCQSLEFRQEVESGVLRGFSYATIFKSLPERSGLTQANIRDHVRLQHLPLDEAMRRVVVEEAARERGVSIEDAEGTLIDHITFAKLGVQRVAERMASGELEPDIKDGIAMASLLLRLQETAGESVDNEVMVQAFMAYWSIVRDMLDDNQAAMLAERIKDNPVLAALMSKQRSTAIAVEANGQG